jgi:hypothetical protein
MDSVLLSSCHSNMPGNLVTVIFYRPRFMFDLSAYENLQVSICYK